MADEEEQPSSSLEKLNEQRNILRKGMPPDPKIAVRTSLYTQEVDKGEVGEDTGDILMLQHETVFGLEQ